MHSIRLFSSCVYVCLLVCGLFPFKEMKAQSDSPEKKGCFYINWGYNREMYTKSTIHFWNNGDPNLKNQYGSYDFKLVDVVAHDKSDFDKLYDVINITIPQFSFRIGYFFNNQKDWGLELNYDHAKYVVTDGQKMRIVGTIHGQYLDKDTIFNPSDFHFEHTDGANFWMLEGIKRWKFYQSASKKINVGFTLKPGFGVVMPRTDVTLFGNNVNNFWKIAGVIAGLESGIRAELGRHFHLEFTGKVAAANYINCLVQGKGNGKAQHSFGVLEGILVLGYQFDWGSKWIHLGDKS